MQVRYYAAQVQLMAGFVYQSVMGGAFNTIGACKMCRNVGSNADNWQTGTSQ
jgi:hypothetical protein